MKQVLSFIQNNTDLNPNDYVVIGVSGGPDSMALLNQLVEFRKLININIVCAHVHHNIRKESDNEALFVKEYCKKFNIIFEMTKLSYDNNFTEALGHKMRYEYFEQIINKYGAKYLFTAHHGDDLVETILMRLVRGSSLAGYAGFNSIVDCSNYKIIRPFISMTKNDILNYLHNNDIPYVIDSSNSDDNYTRNRYRKYILPKLKEENGNVHLKFVKYNRLINDCNDFINEYVDNIYDSIVIDNIIDINRLKKQNKIVIQFIINKWLSSIYQNYINLITNTHVEKIISLISDSKSNKMLYLPRYQIIKAYDKLYLKKIIKQDDYEYILSDKVNLPNGKTISIVSKSNLTNNFVTHLNSNNLNLPLYVRNFRPGDKMTIKNMNGHKKIKDIFINEKVDLQDRYRYPVVIDSSGEIIWLPGIKKSAFDSKKMGKYDIILEYC